MPDMSEILTRLRTALSAAVPNSDEVKRLLAELETQVPDPVARAKILLDSGLTGQGQPTGGGTTPPPSLLNWKQLAGVLGGVAVGGSAVATFGDGNILNRLKFSINIDSTFQLLLLAAALGLFVGFVYSLYHNGWKMVLPTVSRDQTNNSFTVTNFGFIDEMLFGGGFAVLALWAKFPGEGPHAFTESAAFLALTAAVAGARLRCGIWDRDLLRKALVDVVTAPAAPAALARIVRNAPTAAAAVAAATGKEVPGFGPTELPEGVTLPAAIEAKLLKIFDRLKLKERLLARGSPVGPDGDGLTLETLDQFGPLLQNMKPFAKDMRVPEVAAMSADEFVAAVARNGVDVTQARPALIAIHAAATEVMAKLRSLPAGWQVRPDRV